MLLRGVAAPYQTPPCLLTVCNNFWTLNAINNNIVVKHNSFYRKRKQRAEKYATNLSENNNVELSPLNPPMQLQESEYHVLEDEQYDVIPADDFTGM